MAARSRRCARRRCCRARDTGAGNPAAAAARPAASPGAGTGCRRRSTRPSHWQCRSRGHSHRSRSSRRDRSSRSGWRRGKWAPAGIYRSIRACSRLGPTMGLLDGKVAIVTGAGHGVGRGHALDLAAAGAKVVVNDLGGSPTGEGASARDAEVVAEIIKKNGGEAIANFADVSDFAAAKEMIDQAVEVFGGLDILVLNDGIWRDKMIFNMDEA